MYMDVVSYDNNSLPIRHLCSHDSVLRNVIYSIGNLSYTPYADSFAYMIDTIIGQMLSSKVAGLLSERLLNACNGDVSPINLEILTIADLRGIGLSNAKAEYIFGIAKHCRETPNFFKDLLTKSDDEVIEELTKLRGIGPWSAKMYLIFVLDRLDVLPFEDSAFLQTFKWLYPHVELKKRAIQEHCVNWQPYSSIASRYLYKALDAGFTKYSYAEISSSI